MRASFFKIIVTFGMFLVLTKANAAVDLSPEELSQEVVRPKVDKPLSVLHRNITTDGKIEVQFGYGWNFTEPIYEQGALSFGGGYHFSETGGVLLRYISWGKGRNTTYTDPLGSGNKQLDFERIPQLQSSISGLYEWKIYYGKISLSKETVANMHLFPIFGLNRTQFDHKAYWGAIAGAGAKFYFNSQLGMRTSINIHYSQAPSPFLGGGLLNRTNPTRPSPNDFVDKWSFDTMLDFGFFALF